MTNRFRTLSLPVLMALALGTTAQADVIVNIDARHSGYLESPDTPTVGTVVTPVSEAPGGLFNQLTLTAGTYRVTNASGEFGAKFDGFRFNEATTGQNWAWNFLISNASAGNQTVLFGEGASLGASPQELAAQYEVNNFVAEFTLTANAVLNFMIRDNDIGDNTGGVSLRIRAVGQDGTPTAAPEPSGLVLLGVGGLASAFALRRSRRSATISA